MLLDFVFAKTSAILFINRERQASLKNLETKTKTLTKLEPNYTSFSSLINSSSHIQNIVQKNSTHTTS